MTDDLERRVEELRARLRATERRLWTVEEMLRQLRYERNNGSEAARPVLETQPLEEQQPVGLEATPAVTEPDPAAPVVAAGPEEQFAPQPRGSAPEVAPMFVPEPWPFDPQANRRGIPEEPRGRDSLENTLGKSVASWVGALIVLGGVLFFLKFAWDKGYFHLSPTARIVLGLAAGAVMVGTGEWLHFKKMRTLAAAVAGAGLAVLMGSLFAGNTLFAVPVVPRDVAFAGVIVTGALGIVLALRMAAQELAVLALFGMYISPLILRSQEDHSLALLVYLLVVTGSGLVVSFFRQRWPGVRGMAFVGACLWLITWHVAAPVREHFELGLAALLAFFGMFLGEMAANLVRSRGENLADRRGIYVVTLMDEAVSLLSFVNTALTMSLAGVLFSRTGMSGLWIMALGLSGVMTMIALVTPSKMFQISAGLQAMGLLVLAVPLYFEHAAITGAWAILGLALAIYARLTHSGVARTWMLVMVVLVCGRVLLVDVGDEPLRVALFTLGPQSITGWTLLGLGAALYALLLSWLIAPHPIATDAPASDVAMIVNASTSAVACAVLATATWAIVCTIALDHGNSLTLAMALLCGLLMLLQALVRLADVRLHIETIIVIVVAVVTGKWVINEGLLQGVIDTGRGGVIPFLNLFVLNGILLMAAILLRLQKSVSAGGGTEGRIYAGWCIATIAFVIVNVEMLRCVDYWLAGANTDDVGTPWIIKNVAISVLWGVIGFGAILVGFRARVPSVRWAALGLLGVTVGKVLLIDMANVETALRFLCFLVVGGLLLLVSFVYHKAARAAEQQQPA